MWHSLLLYNLRILVDLDPAWSGPIFLVRTIVFVAQIRGAWWLTQVCLIFFLDPRSLAILKSNFVGSCLWVGVGFHVLGENTTQSRSTCLCLSIFEGFVLRSFWDSETFEPKCHCITFAAVVWTSLFFHLDRLLCLVVDVVSKGTDVLEHVNFRWMQFTFHLQLSKLHSFGSRLHCRQALALAACVRGISVLETVS